MYRGIRRVVFQLRTIIHCHVAEALLISRDSIEAIFVRGSEREILILADGTIDGDRRFRHRGHKQVQPPYTVAMAAKFRLIFYKIHRRAIIYIPLPIKGKFRLAYRHRVVELIYRIHPQLQSDQTVAFIFLGQIPSVVHFVVICRLGNIQIKPIFLIMTGPLAHTLLGDSAVISILIEINRMHVDGGRICIKHRVSINDYGLESGVFRHSEMLIN